MSDRLHFCALVTTKVLLDRPRFMLVRLQLKKNRTSLLSRENHRNWGVHIQKLKFVDTGTWWQKTGRSQRPFLQCWLILACCDTACPINKNWCLCRNFIAFGQLLKDKKRSDQITMNRLKCIVKAKTCEWIYVLWNAICSVIKDLCHFFGTNSRYLSLVYIVQRKLFLHCVCRICLLDHVICQHVLFFQCKKIVHLRPPFSFKSAKPGFHQQCIPLSKRCGPTAALMSLVLQ